MHNMPCQLVGNDILQLETVTSPEIYTTTNNNEIKKSKDTRLKPIVNEYVNCENKIGFLKAIDNCLSM